MVYGFRVFSSWLLNLVTLLPLGNGEAFVVEEAAHLMIARKQRTEEEDAEVPRSSSRACRQ